jgi:hypothetical protein
MGMEREQSYGGTVFSQRYLSSVMTRGINTVATHALRLKHAETTILGQPYKKSI